MSTDQDIILQKLKNIYSVKSTSKQVSGWKVALMPMTPHKVIYLLMCLTCWTFRVREPYRFA